jgi:rhomboid protease GluP
MEKMDESERGADSWEAFALGGLAPLGPFAHVHLAPKIPPSLLSAALLTYLPLQDDELLLALIDRGSGKPDGCCALTTRRIYWATVEGEAVGSREAEPPASARRRTRGDRLVVHGVAYSALPATIGESGARDVSPTSPLDLGGGRLLGLQSEDPRLALALVQYLKTMGAAARAGAAPALSQIDPDLAARVARALPAVARVSAQARALNRDLIAFRQRLRSATPRAFVAPVLTVICVAAFVCMVASGVTPFWPSAAELVGWGANEGARVILRHEYWRLITSVFIHGGLLHLAVNMWSLLVIGPLVERLYGNLAFAFLYLAAGIGGAIASIAASPVRVSVGASGAILGVLGALLAFLIVHRRSVPTSVLKPLRSNALGIVVFMAILGTVMANIDQAAHLGGLATGFLGGLLLTRPWPPVAGRRIIVRQVVMAVMIAAALAGAAVAVVSRGEALLPPLNRLVDLQAQLKPAFEEFRSIRGVIPSVSSLERARANPSFQKKSEQTIEELIRRGTANLLRLRRATTPDASLKPIVNQLIQAQLGQLAKLKAARQYLETGDVEVLSGPD